MKQIILVKILSCGKQCKEINTLTKPSSKLFDAKMVYNNKSRLDEINEKWQRAEASIRTFDIDFSHLVEPLQKLIEAAGGDTSQGIHVNYGYNPGSIRQAEIINDKLIKILP